MDSKKKNNHKRSALTVAALGAFGLNPIQAAIAQNTNFNNHGVQDSTDIASKITNSTAYSGAPSTACTSQTVGWNVGSYNCNGTASGCASPGNPGACDVPANSNVLVEDYNGAGSAEFYCDGSNGTLHLNPSSADCAAPPQCPSGNVSWTANGNTCSGTASVGIANATQAVNNTAVGYSGSANFDCIPTSPNTSPTWQVDPGATCNKDCGADTVRWGPGNACFAPIPAGGSGSSSTVNNTTAGYTGQITVDCNALGQWRANGYSSDYCNTILTPPSPPPPPSSLCPSVFFVSYLGSNLDCYSDSTVPATSPGSHAVSYDTQGTRTGAFDAKCSNGQLIEGSGFCGNSPPPPPPPPPPLLPSLPSFKSPCASATLTWTDGNTGQSCTSATAVPSSSDGTSVNVVDFSAPTAGTASFTCNNGTWTQSSGNCAYTDVIYYFFN